MKITLLHGAHEQKSRSRFFEIISTIKKRGWEIKRVDLNELSAIEELTATSIFEQNILYVLENIRDLKSKDLNWLSANADSLDINLLVWHKGEVGKKQQNEFPKLTNFEKFDLPKYIFKFTENLYPKNSKAVLRLLHQTTETEPPEFVLALVAGTLLDLSIIKAGGSLDYPAWRKGKLKSQAEKFSNSQLKSLLKDLSRIDIESKTGGPNLSTGLDIVIAKTLQ